MEKEKIKELLDTVSYDSPGEFLYIYVVKGCGCGNAATFEKDFWDMFVLIAEENPKTYETIYKDNYNELIAQMLDAAGLLEHGSSIGGSWLNETGQWLYEALKEKPSNR